MNNQNAKNEARSEFLNYLNTGDVRNLYSCIFIYYKERLLKVGLNLRFSEFCTLFFNYCNLKTKDSRGNIYINVTEEEIVDSLINEFNIVKVERHSNNIEVLIYL